MSAQNDTAAINADDTLVSADGAARRLVSQATCVLALAVYAAYLVYRAAFTLNGDAIVFSGLVYFAEVHGFFSLALYFHQVWHLRRRRVVPPAQDLKVDVFVTTYNEDIDLLRQTLRAAVAMRYPHTTYVLDDGRREAVRALAAEIGCAYLTRPDNAHAKAGNWNNAFKQTGADFIATFDADHVPRPDFLERTLGFFRDPKVAIVQVPQQYHNLDSVQHSVSWKARRMYGEQDAFFNLVMPGKDHWNAAFFCGTGAVLRRAALAPHGGILTNTITEDLHTSIVLHAEGWKSVYLNELLVTGLAPVDLTSFAVQRLRWAEGNLKAATISNPLTTRGLSGMQRVSYLASLYHWSIGLPKLIYYLAPGWILFTGTFPIANFDRTFVAIYLTFLATLIGSYQIVSRGKGRLLMDELFNMVSFFTLLKAVKRAALGRGKPGRFEVTAKRGSGTQDLAPILPHVVLLGFSLLAIIWSLMGLGFGVSDDVAGAATAIFWTLYNASLMVAVIRIGGRPAEKRAGVRFRANFAVEAADDAGGSGRLGVTADLSDQGCALLWPDHLEIGARLPLRLHLGPHQPTWTAEVVSRKGLGADGWHHHGIRFVDLTPADVDLINDALFGIVVPDLFRWLSEPSWIIRAWRRARRSIDRHVRGRAKRQVVRVPVRVTHAFGSFVSTIRDLSATGLGLQSPVSLEIGSTVHLVLTVPGRTTQVSAVVVRSEARRSREGLDTWLLGLRFDAAQPVADIRVFQQQEAA